MAEAPDRLQKWLGFTQSLYSNLDPEQCAHTILTATLELTSMEHGFITVPASESGYRFLFGMNSAGVTQTLSDFPASEQTVQAAFEKRSLQLISYSSGFCMPLFSYRGTPEATRVVAVLCAYGNTETVLDEEEKEVLDVIAHHSGPALETAMLFDLATRDPLTHLSQRHYFDSVAVVEWRRTIRHRHPISVLMVDIDEFRDFNDRLGRAEGDRILRELAEILKEACRTEDIISRYGGEEFVALLPETESAGARHLANRILEDAAKLLAPDKEPSLTVSIGVATYPHCHVSSAQELVRLAEIAQNMAKQAGKNRVVVYEPSLSKAHTKLFK